MLRNEAGMKGGPEHFQEWEPLLDYRFGEVESCETQNSNYFHDRAALARRTASAAITGKTIRDRFRN